MKWGRGTQELRGTITPEVTPPTPGKMHSPSVSIYWLSSVCVAECRQLLRLARLRFSFSPDVNFLTRSRCQADGIFADDKQTSKQKSQISHGVKC